MSMYECDYCGNDHGHLAKVFVAVNTSDPVYPYHRTLFDEKFSELWTPTGVQHYDPEGWKKFWQWLGDNEIKWFCCTECAIEYLKNSERKKNEKTDGEI